MSQKKQRAKQIMRALSGLEYTVLDDRSGTPIHVRVEGYGDIWPTTGTYRKYDGSKGKGVNGFLGKDCQEEPDLEKRVSDLEEYVAHLEHELSEIKGMLVI